MELKALALANVVVLLIIGSSTLLPPEILPLAHEPPARAESATHMAHVPQAPGETTITQSPGQGTARLVEDCGVCDLHPELSPWRHKAAPSEFWWPATEGLGWHPDDWIEGGCLTNHPYSCEDCVCPNLCGANPQCLEDCLINECGGGQFGGDYVELVEAIRSGTLNAFEMATTRVTFEVNEERGALQVLDCHGAVIVHAPLPTVN